MEGSSTVQDAMYAAPLEWASIGVEKGKRISDKITKDKDGNITSREKRYAKGGESYYAGDGLNKAHITPENIKKHWRIQKMQISRKAIQAIVLLAILSECGNRTQNVENNRVDDTILSQKPDIDTTECKEMDSSETGSFVISCGSGCAMNYSSESIYNRTIQMYSFRNSDVPKLGIFYRP